MEEKNLIAEDTQVSDTPPYPFAYMQIDDYFEVKSEYAEVKNGQARMLMIAKRWALKKRKDWVFRSSLSGEGLIRIRRVK